MKKVFGILLILALGLFAVTGCNQATSTTPTEAPEGADVAGSVGGLMMLSTTADTIATGSMGISAVSAVGVKAMEQAGDLTYNASSGWWTFTYSTLEGLVEYNFKAQAYTAGGEEITELPLSNANQLKIVAAVTWGSTITFNFGTDASPLIFNGILSGAKSLNGTINSTVTDDASNTYTLQLVYSGVTLDSYGLPESGTATFSFSSNDFVAVDASLEFTGSHTAILTFTAPTELSTIQYSINLVTGVATPIS